MGLRKDQDNSSYSEFNFDEEQEDYEELTHRKEVRRLLEDKLERKRLRKELEDEFEDDFDWEDFDTDK